MQMKKVKLTASVSRIPMAASAWRLRSIGSAPLERSVL
ncbi:MAG: hypothetical protein OJF48_001916 [Afipia sp.]|nr:MAG: hypothetical protein OJF48_001916 [Afipia sp.]